MMDVCLLKFTLRMRNNYVSPQWAMQVLLILYSRTQTNSVKDSLSYIALSHIAMYGQIGYSIDIKDILYLSRTPTQLPSTNK